MNSFLSKKTTAKRAWQLVDLRFSKETETAFCKDWLCTNIQKWRLQAVGFLLGGVAFSVLSAFRRGWLPTAVWAFHAAMHVPLLAFLLLPAIYQKRTMLPVWLFGFSGLVACVALGLTWPFVPETHFAVYLAALFAPLVCECLHAFRAFVPFSVGIFVAIAILANPTSEDRWAEAGEFILIFLPVAVSGTVVAHSQALLNRKHFMHSRGVDVSVSLAPSEWSTFRARTPHERDSGAGSGAVISKGTQMLFLRTFIVTTIAGMAITIPGEYVVLHATNSQLCLKIIIARVAVNVCAALAIAPVLIVKRLWQWTHVAVALNVLVCGAISIVAMAITPAEMNGFYHTIIARLIFGMSNSMLELSVTIVTGTAVIVSMMFISIWQDRDVHSLIETVVLGIFGIVCIVQAWSIRRVHSFAVAAAAADDGSGSGKSVVVSMDDSLPSREGMQMEDGSPARCAWDPEPVR